MVKLKIEIIIEGISQDFIDIIIFKQVMTFLKLYIWS